MRAEREGFDLQWPGSDAEETEEINQQILPQESQIAPSVPIHSAPVFQATPQPVQMVAQPQPPTQEPIVMSSTNGSSCYQTPTATHQNAYQNSSPNSSPRELTPQLHKRSQMTKSNSLSDYNLYNGMTYALTLFLDLFQDFNKNHF